MKYLISGMIASVMLVSCGDSAKKNTVPDHDDNILVLDANPSSGNGSIVFPIGGKTVEEGEGAEEGLMRVTAAGSLGAVNHLIVVLFDKDSGAITKVTHRWSEADPETDPEATTSCADDECSLVTHDQELGYIDFGGVVLNGTTPAGATSTLLDHIHYE